MATRVARARANRSGKGRGRAGRARRSLRGPGEPPGAWPAGPGGTARPGGAGQLAGPLRAAAWRTLRSARQTHGRAPAPADRQGSRGDPPGRPRGHPWASRYRWISTKAGAGTPRLLASIAKRIVRSQIPLGTTIDVAAMHPWSPLAARLRLRFRISPGDSPGKNGA